MHLVEHMDLQSESKAAGEQDFGNPLVKEALRDVAQARLLMARNVNKFDMDFAPPLIDESDRGPSGLSGIGMHLQSSNRFDQDLEATGGKVAARKQLSEYKPRDFNTEIPVLVCLGAEGYDKQDIGDLEIDLKKPMKKFQKDWKTRDQEKINYLMQMGIVNEVMKIEERKTIRRIAASQPKTKSHKAQNQDLVAV
jgi:hypothetical protein